MGKRESAFFSSLIENGRFRVDPQGHAYLLGEFLFLIPPDVLIHLQEKLEEKVGKEEMVDTMKELGGFQTQQALERYSEKEDLDNVEKEKILQWGFKIMNVLGWGDITIDHVDKEEENFRVRVEHPTFPAVYRNKKEEMAEKPICHYLNGMIKEGMRSIVFEDELEVEETSCAAVEGKICVFEGEVKD